MTFDHACFLSFPRHAGRASQFAEYFYRELVDQLAVCDTRLSIFKYDRKEERRRGDDWTIWIERELCHSAMMIAIGAPSYFNGNSGCVSEFRGMENLIAERSRVLPIERKVDWIIGARIKDTVPMPALDPYRVIDFLDCCASPRKVQTLGQHRKTIAQLAEDIWQHWRYVNESRNLSALVKGNLCGTFRLPPPMLAPPDPFPSFGGEP